MNDYLIDTRSAVQGILKLINREETMLEKKKGAFASMDDASRNVFEYMQQNRADSTLLIELDGFETAKDRIDSKIDNLHRLIANLQPTYRTLAGALLQIAKQGISMRHGGLSSCPDGRIVGSTEPLKNVIWQARNQSVHYEEGKYHKSVVDCFSNLASDFGPRFALGSKNLALDVIEILGWRSYVKL